MNEMKKENMAKFVQATRDELNKIWDSCFYGDEQRREFAPAFSDDYTDDLLSAHESELDRMRGFYKDNEGIYKLVQKRENLWKKFIELEVCSPSLVPCSPIFPVYVLAFQQVTLKSCE